MSKEHLLSGFPVKGLWPIVTLSFNDKTITLSLRQAYISRWEFRDNAKLAVDIRTAVLRLLGIKRNSLGIAQDRIFNQQVLNIILKIDSKIKKSIHNKNIAKARDKSTKKHVLTNLRSQLSQFIKSWRLSPTSIRKHEVAEMWNELMKELVVAEIHDK